MKRKRGLFIALVIGTAVMACALPGQPAASPPPPTPDTRLERMVAETVDAALLMTQQAAPTPTKIPPTPTLTATPAPTATLSAESVLDQNDDGAYSFIDLPGKYQATIPAQWVAMRVNAPEIELIRQMPEAAEPAIQRSLAAIEVQDPNVFRLFLLDVAEERYADGFVTNVNFVWDRQMEVSLADDTDLQGLAATLPASLENSEVTETELNATPNEIPYGVIMTKTPALTQEGEQIVVIQKLVFFDLPAGTLTITLSTTEDWLETVEPSFDEIIESFILLG